MPRILDLYCGMGGLSLGFALALENPEISGYDIDACAVETYNLNLSKLGCKAYASDLLKKELDGEWDLVIGGVPCQPFSVANISKGGEKHRLYPTFPRFFHFVMKLKPKAFLMENVKGLVSRKHKHLLERELSLVSREYFVEYAVLNAADYGVPQKRERLFLLGIRRDLGIMPDFPPKTHSEAGSMTLHGKLDKWITVKEAIGDLLDHEITLITPKRSLTDRTVETTHKPIFLSEEPSPTVTVSGLSEIICWNFSDESMRKHRPQSLDEPARTVRASWANTPPDALIGLGKILSEKAVEKISRMGIRTINLNAPSNTITKFDRGYSATEQYLKIGAYYRRLSVKECLRLQSFPDWWRFLEGTSRTRMYKLVGEAVPPILAYKMATHIARLLGWGTREPPKPEEWELPYFYRAFQEYYNA